MEEKHIQNLFITNGFYQLIEDEALKCKIYCYITSGYRSKLKNKAVGGSENSLHMQAKAVDIGTTRPEEVYQIVENMINRGVIPQGGLGLYKGHVHYDWRGTKKRWTKY